MVSTKVLYKLIFRMYGFLRITAPSHIPIVCLYARIIAPDKKITRPCAQVKVTVSQAEL